VPGTRVAGRLAFHRRDRAGPLAKQHGGQRCTQAAFVGRLQQCQQQRAKIARFRVANRLCLPAATAGMPTAASARCTSVASRCERTSTAMSPGCTGRPRNTALPARASTRIW
jgi:hypothetical protein